MNQENPKWNRIDTEILNGCHLSTECGNIKYSYRGMIAARDCAREMNRTKSKFETFRYKMTELGEPTYGLASIYSSYVVEICQESRSVSQYIHLTHMQYTHTNMWGEEYYIYMSVV